MSRGRLLLVEDQRHVDDFVARGCGRSEDRWLAVGPSAMAALEARGLAYVIPEDFHPWADLQTVCAAIHGRVERLCDELDRRLLAAYPHLERLGIQPFLFRIFPLMILFDSLASRAFQLARVLNAHPELVAVAHARSPQPPGAFELLFSSEDTLWARVLHLFAARAAVEILADEEVAARRPRSRDLARRIVGRSVTLTTLAVHASARDPVGAVRALRPDARCVLVVDGSAEWLPARPALRAHDLRARYASEARFAVPQPVGERDAELDAIVAETFTSLFELEGVSLYPLLADRLSAVWRSAPSNAQETARRVGAVCRRHRVSAVLRASAATGTAHTLNVAARAAGAPVCVWQHGMVTNRGGISQFRDYADVMTADMVLAFGEDSARAYARSGKRWPQAALATVGSASLDAFRARVPPRRRTPPRRILYATTNYARNNWYLGFAPGVCDRWLYRDQREVCRALVRLAGARGCEVRVKLHPNDAPPWAHELDGEPGIEVIRVRPGFKDLLAWSDVVVLDLPSTTLLQALAARRPTFVLLRHWRTSTEVEALLRRAAVARETVGELCADLESYLRSGRFPADPDDSAFLETCGIGPPGAAAAERAAVAVAGMLVRGRQSPTTG